MGAKIQEIIALQGYPEDERQKDVTSFFVWLLLLCVSHEKGALRHSFLGEPQLLW